MVNNVSFKYDQKLVFQVKKESNGIDLQIDSNDCTFILSLNREDAITLFYKLRYFIEKNYVEEDKSKGEKICITTRLSQEKLKEPSTFKEISAFLHSMTATDVGFFKKHSPMDNLFQGNGDMSTKFLTLPKKNG